MIEQSGLHVSHICDKETVSRSTYYRLQEEPCINSSDIALRQLINEIASEFPFYGYRRMTKELQHRGERTNHKHVLRIMREDNLLCRRKKAFKPVTTNSNHSFKIYPNLAKDMVVTGLNQLWVADITYIHLPREFAYL